ncbi:kinetochore-associated protein 1 isoform X2 [Nilaparvata lugens]|uniref:kinetochore-associated protein 1 isoform X2 n=1 Tax=Nilaparvata lugens TaxID=108931 RepID=UPI00193E4BFF|nr:kinetochore-associated protein 1 isoform X2 [Nilaparvata lugens]
MWDKFTFGLNTEGESVNFGTKLSNDDNIYAFETKTLATIHRNAAENVEVDGLSQSFKPISVSHQKSICIAIENSLVIFDATCSQVLLNINFNAKITSYNMCNDGAFLFVALSNLEIYCVQCAMAKYERIFSNAETSFEIKQQSKLPNEIVSIFIEHNESKNVINLFFIFTSGMIVRLSELDINLLEESFNCDNSQEKLENIFANTTHSKLISTLLNSNNAVRAVCDFKRNLFISNGKLLMKCSLDCIDQPDKESSDVDIGISSIKCAMPDQILLKKLECGQRFLFGITSDENLIVICPVTLITLSILPFKTCIDFTVVKGKSEEAILIFTSNKIISVSSYDFSEKYVINLPNSSLPVYNQNEDDPAFEEILFVELSDEKSLTVKVLEETQPDARLKKLLRKGRFEEAKKFCTFFGLDIQIVHRAEAARVFEELMPWTQSKPVTVDEFIVLLELIEDIEFVGDYCINAITADLRDILKLLNYGMRRVKQTLNRSEQDEEKEAAPDRRALLKLYSMMGSLVQRLNTFIIIQQSPSPSASFDLWISFSKANLLSEVREHLRKGELNAAKTILCRHWNEIRGKLKYNAAIEMLSELPDSISVQESADWTRELVGNVLLNDPSSLASIVDWTVEKALSYDLIDRDSWLEKGISLAELMLDIVLKVEESDAAVGLENILIEKLSAFLTTLRQISCLKLVYHINITYKHFVEVNITIEKK